MDEKVNTGIWTNGFIWGFMGGIIVTGLLILGHIRDTNRDVRELKQQLAAAEQRATEYNIQLGEYSKQLADFEQREVGYVNQLREYGSIASGTVADMGDILQRNTTTFGDMRKTIQDLKDCLLRFDTALSSCRWDDNISSNEVMTNE